jgi:hypothetical protein
MRIDAEQALIACEAKRFKAYLIWRVRHSRVKKESTIITYWKVLSMVYARSTCRYMDEGVLYDLKNVCSLSQFRAWMLTLDSGFLHI